VFSAQTTFNTSGLGASGTMTSGLPATATLQAYGAQLIANQANLLANATTQQTNEDAYSDALQKQLSNITGVSLDTEMANMLAIQKSYGAAAQMIKTVSKIFDDLISVVNT